METKHLLAFVSIGLFLVYFFFKKFTRKSYLLFLLFIFPFIDLNITPEKFGSISVFDFLSWLTLLFLFEYTFNFQRKNNYYYLISGLTAILFIGSIISHFIENSFFSFLKYLSIFIYSKMLIDECLKNFSFIKLVIKSLKLGCILSLIFLLIQLIVGTKFTFYPDLNPNTYLGLESDTMRYPSFFQDPQKYGQYLSMVSFLFLINRKNKSTPDLLNTALFILVVLAIFLTGGRAASLGIVIGLVIILLSKKSKVWIIAVFSCLFGYFIITNFSEYFSLFNRSEDYNTSYENRNEIWDEGLQIFFANPLLGIGIGNHHNYIVDNSSSGYYLIDKEIVYYGTESGYLKILIECGLLGFILVFFLIVIPIVNAFRSYLHSRNFNLLFLIASIISWMVAFTSVYSLEDKRILVIVITLLCLLIISKNSPNAIHV